MTPHPPPHQHSDIKKNRNRAWLWKPTGSSGFKSGATYTGVALETRQARRGLNRVRPFLAHEMMDKSHVAVLGITSGAWDETIASRIPKEWTVEIHTDHDNAGHAYAKKIRQSLPHHEVTRG